MDRLLNSIRVNIQKRWGNFLKDFVVKKEFLYTSYFYQNELYKIINSNELEVLKN